MQLRVAVIVGALLAAPAVAQPDPLVRPLPPAASGTEALGKFLRDIGFDPKSLSPDVFQISVERERWPVHVMLSLSTDGRRIWLESKFAPVEDPDRVPPTTWKRLLEANEKIGPAHFAFDKNDRRVHLYKSFDNVALTSERLRREIDAFDATVRKTQDYWRGENFRPVIGSNDPPPLPPAPTPMIPAAAVPVSREVVPVPAIPASREVTDVDKLLADWEVVAIQIKGRKTPDDVLKERKASVRFRPAANGRLTAEIRLGPDQTRTVSVKIDPDRPAKHIDFADDRERAEPGIYKIEGSTLTMCFAAPGEPRPVAFTSGEESKNWVIVLRKR
jgi:uncharacterized protein (TIGR03067 family)